MKIQNFFCHTCDKNIPSQEAVGKKHAGCGGRVTWRTSEVRVVSVLVSDESKAVAV